VCIYLETGNEPKSSLKTVIDSGYAILDRAKLLEFFGKYTVQNDIYADFVDHLKYLDETWKRYKDLRFEAWGYPDWEGFYLLLEDALEVGGWGYVANPSGGFIGLWWNFLTWKEHEVYLQIEQGNLCFKMAVDAKEKRSEAQNEWHAILMKQAEQEGRKEIQRPSHMRSGTYMTCAIVKREDWLGKDDELLDRNRVIARLTEYEQFLSRCANGT